MGTGSRGENEWLATMYHARRMGFIPQLLLRNVGRLQFMYETSVEASDRVTCPRVYCVISFINYI